jgi:hypothetical protein
MLKYELLFTKHSRRHGPGEIKILEFLLMEFQQLPKSRVVAGQLRVVVVRVKIHGSAILSSITVNP